MPVMGAVLADSYWGKYRTTLVSLLVIAMVISNRQYLTCQKFSWITNQWEGLVIIIISAVLPALRPTPCEWNLCISARLTQMLTFFSGLYIFALGCGGVISTLLAFEADQFDNNSWEREEKACYFSWYYAIVNLGTLTAGTLLVCTERISWGLGYGTCASCVAVAAASFVLGTPTYRILIPEGSPLIDLLQELTAFSCEA